MGVCLYRKILSVVASVLFVTTILFSSTLFVSAENELEIISTAQSSINEAFTNVLAAEKAGGNVTALLAKLNSAGSLLAAAENSYKNGNFANITSKVHSAVLIANQVNTDAIALREDSLAASQNSFWLTLTFTIVGSVIFSLVLWFGWRSFKKHFMDRLLGKQPEVVPIE